MTFNWDQVPSEEVNASGSNVDFSAITAQDYEEIMVLSLRVTIVADGTAATRELTARVDNSGGNPIFRIGGVDATAGQTKAMNLAPGVPYTTTPVNGDEIILPLPEPCIIPKSGRVRIEVSAGQAGDVITSRALVKKRRYLKT